MAINDPTLITRFWSKVDRRGDDECWPWLAYKSKKGCGAIKVGGKRGAAVQARHIAYQIANGDVPDGMSVRLSCDDASCCNPKHIFLKPISISPEERIERNRKRHRIVKIIRDPVSKDRIANKATYIYGLVDPRTTQLRYVGKTVLAPDRRVFVHKWRAKKQPHKNHSMAWLLNLVAAGTEPEVFTIEEVPPGGDWVEAEQFWIAYFRSIGADLCNHTVGGEGAPGHKQSPETIAKRVKRGPEHHSFGKPQHPNSRAALKAAMEKFHSDPIAMARANERRVATLNSTFHFERMRAQNARLLADPAYKAALYAKIAESGRTPEARARTSAQSKLLWASKREQMIAALNAGKGDEWRRKHSEIGRARLQNPNHPFRKLAVSRRKLTDGDVLKIRLRVTAGEKASALAREYGVDPSTISHIKSGRDR